MTVPPYPLQWPEGRPRKPILHRMRSPFRTGLAKAIENVKGSLRGFQKDAGIKIEHVVLSSDADMMTDNPKDSGVAALVERAEYHAILRDPSRISDDYYSRSRAADLSFIAILAHTVGVVLIFWSAK